MERVSMNMVLSMPCLVQSEVFGFVALFRLSWDKLDADHQLPFWDERSHQGKVRKATPDKNEETDDNERTIGPD